MIRGSASQSKKPAKPGRKGRSSKAKSRRGPRRRSLPTVEGHLAKKQLRRRLAIALAVVVLGLLVFADRANLLLHDGGDWARYHDTQVRVVAVIDGDTIDVDLPDGTHATTRVRIWGIDTPELARDDREAEPFAEAAREHAKAIALGEVVTLKLQAHQTRGRFGRLVAYAQLGDGTYFGERMLIAGLAEADSRFSHDRIDRYELLQQQAQFDDVGMWAE